LIGRSVGRSVRRSVGQLVGWLIGRLIDWSVGRSVGWLVGRLVGWSVGWQDRGNWFQFPTHGRQKLVMVIPVLHTETVFSFRQENTGVEETGSSFLHLVQKETGFSLGCLAEWELSPVRPSIETKNEK
jgi:hypothetical protein